MIFIIHLFIYFLPRTMLIFFIEEVVYIRLALVENYVNTFVRDIYLIFVLYIRIYKF